TRVALGVLVGEHRALRLEHGAGDEVLARDHLEGALLALQLAIENLGDVRVELGDGLVEDVHGASCGDGAERRYGLPCHLRTAGAVPAVEVRVRGPGARARARGGCRRRPRPV